MSPKDCLGMGLQDLALRLQRAKWLAKQSQIALRARVQATQSELNSMTDRGYKRLARSLAQERASMAKRVQDGTCRRRFS